MMIGDSHVFAIESSITKVYEQLSLRALGYFVIFINGFCYGVHKPDATMLACSFDEVERRIRQRNRHIANFSKMDADKIAYAFQNALYSNKQEKSYFGITLTEFCKHFDRDANDLVWAPDGDEAFDDGSYILQFDVGDLVRLIAFKSEGYSYDKTTLSEVWIESEKYYQLLQSWYEWFDAEWKRLLDIKHRL
jgi:hypothetical protein